MAEPQSDSQNDPGLGPRREATTSMPRWVKISLIIVAVLMLLFIVLKVTGLGGEHGPGRHLGTGPTVSTSTTADHTRDMARRMPQP